jgi:hypothetical protein
VEGFAGAGLFQVMRRQGANQDDEPVDISQPLSDAQIEQYKRQILLAVCYVCQGCGNLNMMAGEHCAHCRFAPANFTDAQLTIVLSSSFFKTQTLLSIALQIQRGRKPHEFINGLDEMLDSIDSDQGILKKIQDHQEDDYLNFKAWDKCQSCGHKVWPSSADTCPHCKQPLSRPTLLKLAICVMRLLSQLVWTIAATDSREFDQFVVLLLNLKYQLIRCQAGPTDAQRHKATQLLLKLSPLYTQNRGGLVCMTNPTTVLSEVIDPSVHQDIGPTVDYLRDEVKHFLHLMSDSVSLL